MAAIYSLIETAKLNGPDPEAYVPRVLKYVTTIDCETYKEHVTEDNLGGGQGYFLIRAWKKGDISRFDVLAKAPSFDAAGDLFDMLVSRSG